MNVGVRIHRIVSVRNSLSVRSLYLTLSLALSQVMSAIAFAVCARTSESASEFGAAVAVVSLAVVVASFADFGLSAYCVREVASGRMSFHLMYGSLLSRLVLVATLCVFWAVGANILTGLNDFESNTLGASLVVLTVCVQMAQVPLRAVGSVGWLSVAQIVDRITFLLCTFAAVAAGFGGRSVLLISLCGGLSVDLLVCCFAVTRRRSLHRLLIDGRDLVKIWDTIRAYRPAVGFGVAGALGGAQQLDVPVLSASGGVEAAGIYAAVSRWTSPLILSSTAFTQVVLPKVASATTTKSAILSVRKVSWILFLGVLASVGVATSSNWFATSLLGSKFEASSTSLSVLAVAAIFTIFSQPLAMLLQVRSRDRWVASALAIALIIKLACVWLLGPVMQSMAAAYGVLIQQVMIFAAMVFMLYVSWGEHEVGRA